MSPKTPAVGSAEFVPNMTAVEQLKQANNKEPNLANLLRRFADDKQYDHSVIAEMGLKGLFGKLFERLVQRSEDTFNNYSLFNYFATNVRHFKAADCVEYHGAGDQNEKIDMAASAGFFATSGETTTAFGRGASTNFNITAGTFALPDNVTRTPIAVVGYGAAGVLATHILRNLGFGRISVFEKSKPNGIWSRENVYAGSRNNPRDLHFFDRELEAAPGSGIEVRDFLNRFHIVHRPVEVVGIEPGKLNHVLKLGDRTEETFPIVINCIGLGKPNKINDPQRMTTTADTTESGIRWQQNLEADKVRGKKLVFIGLGNSTAEMLRQVHRLQDQGVDVDYVVATHFDRNTVYNPDETSDQYDADDRLIRVFRDTSKPNLVDFQGDLPQSRYDYFRALRNGRIIAGVRHWRVKNNNIAFYRDHGGVIKIAETKYDSLYTLIGYKHDEATLAKYGCSYDSGDNRAIYDYDGEFVNDDVPRAEGLHKGYFGFGAVLDSPYNRNAIVIPGMLHRAGDLAFGVVARAYEASRPKKELAAETSEKKS